MPSRSPRQRVDIVRDQQTGKEMVVSSVDLSDTVQGEDNILNRKFIFNVVIL